MVDLFFLINPLSFFFLVRLIWSWDKSFLFTALSTILVLIPLIIGDSKKNLWKWPVGVITIASLWGNFIVGYVDKVRLNQNVAQLQETAGYIDVDGRLVNGAMSSPSRYTDERIKANDYIKHGEYDRAYKIGLDLTKNNHKFSFGYIYMAAVDFSRNDFKNAKSNLNKALQGKLSRSDTAWLYRFQGYIFVKEKMFDEALKSLEKSLSFDQNQEGVEKLIKKIKQAQENAIYQKYAWKMNF